jgi:hypothetical protein
VEKYNLLEAQEIIKDIHAKGIVFSMNPKAMSPHLDLEGNRKDGNFEYLKTNIRNLVESFNGSTWTSVNSMNTSRLQLAGCGTQTAALGFGGSTSPGITLTAATELWNGTSWTSKPTGLNTARRLLAGCGIQTAALAFGGAAPANSAATESFNGSTWTSVSSLNTAVVQLGGCGTQTAALSFGGGPPNTAATEQYNGTSWTSAPPMATARAVLAGAGIQTAGLAFGGTVPGTTAATEEFSGPQSTATASTLTTS